MILKFNVDFNSLFNVNYIDVAQTQI